MHGSRGGSWDGATLVRATGLRPSSSSSHSPSSRRYSSLNRMKPSMLYGRGQRSCTPHRAERPRPCPARCASTRSKPSRQGGWSRRMTWTISYPGSAITPEE